MQGLGALGFPHLRVGTFIEALYQHITNTLAGAFPHLRVGTFIEALCTAERHPWRKQNFPTFGWGLSLRLR